MISQILKKTDFHERRRKINKVTSNEVKHVVEARKKLKWYITSYTKLVNNIMGEVKAKVNRRSDKWV